MSGHSKWANIKHQKGMADAKRGQVFTRIAREIILSVKEGGPSSEGNFRLRLAIQKARDSNMPMENIDRAIKRGSGQSDGAILVEMVMEGYGPGGMAILVNATSDNRNRTLQEVRNLFSRHGGNMGEAGCVSWLFDSRGVLNIDTRGQDADTIALEAIDAGAEDVKIERDFMEVYTTPSALEKVSAALKKKSTPIRSAELSMVPKTMVQLDEKAGLTALKLLDKLEELDDVSAVSSNADFSDAILEKYQALGPTK
jgi:YebC/PmpR family DNA-binding regulatory protein